MAVYLQDVDKGKKKKEEEKKTSAPPKSISVPSVSIPSASPGTQPAQRQTTSGPPVAVSAIEATAWKQQQDYLDALYRNAGTQYIPNSHAAELNQNMLEQGLAPIYTSNQAAKPFSAADYYDHLAKVYSNRQITLAHENGASARRQRKRAEIELADLQFRAPSEPENDALFDRISELEKFLSDYDQNYQAYKGKRDLLDAQILQAKKKAEFARTVPDQAKQYLERMAIASDENDQYNVVSPLEGFAAGVSGQGASSVNYVKQREHTATQQEGEDARQSLYNMGYNYDEVEEMFSIYKDVRNDEIERRNAASAARDAADYPILTSLFSVPVGLIGNVLGSVGMFASNGERNNPTYTGLSRYANTVQSTVQANIENSVREKIEDPSIANFFAKVAGYGYAGATSAAQSALAMGLGAAAGAPWLGETLLGVGAASQTYNDMLIKGYSYEDALTSGVVSGLIETLTEHVSLENLKWLKASGGGLKNLPLNLVKSFVTEGSEEIASDLLNEAWDYFAHGGMSEYYQFVTRYLEEHRGATEAEARSAYAQQFGEQLFESGVIGGFSGMLGAGWTGTANSVRSGIVSNIENRETGNVYQNVYQRMLQEQARGNAEANPADMYTDLLQTALTLPEGSKARQNLVNMQETFQTESPTKRQVRQQGKAINAALTELNQTDEGRAAANKYQYNLAVQNWAATGTSDEVVDKSILTRYGVTEETMKKAVDEKKGITAEKIVAIDNGVATVQTSDGRTVRADEAQFKSRDQAALYLAAPKLGYNASTTNDIIQQIDSTRDVPVLQQMLALDDAVRYGRAGTQLTNEIMQDNTLTAEQLAGAYTIGRGLTELATRQRQNLLQQARERMVTQQKITVDGKTENIYTVGGLTVNSMKESQKVQAGALMHLAKAVTKNKIILYASELNEDGQRVVKTNIPAIGVAAGDLAPNAAYDRATGDIYVDINAGQDGTGLMLFHASHEFVHYIKQWNPAKFLAMQDFLVKEVYGDKLATKLIRDQMDKAKANGRTLTEEEAAEEMVADALQEMLTRGDVMEKIAKLKQQDRSLWQKLKDFITNKAKRIREIYKGVDPESREAQKLREAGDAIQRLADMFAEGLVEAGENFEAASILQENALFSDHTIPGVVDGIQIDEKTDSIAPVFDLRSWMSSEYVQKRKEAIERVMEKLKEDGGTEEERREKATKYIDDINSIAKMIADDRVRLDYEAAPDMSAFVGNVEYGGSLDFSTLCAKRRLLTGTLQAIQERIGDGVLSPIDILDIRNMMKEKKYVVNCGLCYVEGSRTKMGTFAQEFIKRYQVYNPNADWIPTMKDVFTPDGIEDMRIQHPEAYKAYEKFWNNHGVLNKGEKTLFASQQKPKMYQKRTNYKGEILEKFHDSKDVEKKNENGGIRIQSFSDFELVHMLDMMQVIMDMSRVGLAGQAYTKVPEFAWAFGNTGLKINLSLIAKGVDENGKLIFDDVEGMPHKEAFDIRSAFSKNVGTIIVTFDDAQLKAAMADERIDFIIPFHRSQWTKAQYGDLGLPETTKDYTYQQNEKFIKPQYHEYMGRLVRDKAKNYMPNTYWNHDVSGKENAERYLQMCHKENKRPKFYKLLDQNADGSYSLKKDGSTDGYWKLLIDFKMYDNDGVGAKQMPVKPVFNLGNTGNALADAHSIQSMLNAYEGGHNEFPVAEDIVEAYVKRRGQKDAKLSARDGGRVAYSGRDLAPTFYSQLERTVENMKMDKIGAASVVSFLKGRGVKDEEIKWSGIRTFLEGKKSVTKAELQAFLKENEIRIERVVRDTEYDSNNYYQYRAASSEALTRAREKIVNESLDIDLHSLTVDYNGEGGFDVTSTETGELVYTYEPEKKATKWGGYKFEGGENYREYEFKLPGSDYTNRAMQTHWGDKGVIAHARVQDFENDDGDRVLFVEEIQSDWNNAGQKEGFGKQPPKLSVKRETNRYGQPIWRLYEGPYETDHWNYVSQDQQKIEKLEAQGIPWGEGTEYDDLYPETEEEVLQEFIKNNGDEYSAKSVPDAPYAGESSSYVPFVLKNLLREAAEHGYDYLGWTTAQQQADRWSDSYMEGYRIEYDQEIPKFLKKYGKQWGATVGDVEINAPSSSAAFDSDTEQRLYDRMNFAIDSFLALYDFENDVDGLFGQSVSEEAMRDWDEKSSRLHHEAVSAATDFAEAVSAAVGIRGYLDVDDTVSTFAESIDASSRELAEEELRDWCDAQIEQARDNGGASDTTAVHGMAITDAMRNSVLYEGQAKFSSRNEVLNRNDVDWMDDFSSIKDQLQKHRAEISKQDPVVAVEYGGEDKRDLERLIMGQVKKVGGERFSRNGLAFSFDEKGIHSVVLHARTPELRAAALASPYVAKRGKLIAGQKNHENTNTTTITFAAPVVIDGNEAHVGVVIQFTNDGRARAVNLEYQVNGQKKKPARGLRSRTSHSYVSDLLTNADFYKENTTDKEKSQGDSSKKSDREASGTDARTLLSGALMDVAQTDDERKLLTKYQSEIAERNAEEAKLNETRREIRDMMFRKGPRDEAYKKKLADLKTEAQKSANRLEIYDKRLLKLEATKPLKSVLETERQNAIEKERARSVKLEMDLIKAAGKENNELRKQLQRQKDASDRKIARLEADIEHRKDMRQKGIDQRASNDLRTRIENLRKDFAENLSKDKTIPPALVTGVIDVCNLIDPVSISDSTQDLYERKFDKNGKPYWAGVRDASKFTQEEIDKRIADGTMRYASKSELSQETGRAKKEKSMRAALLEMKQAYESLKTNQNISYDFKSEFEQELADRIGILADAVGNTPLRAMSRTQLEDVYDAMVEIRHTLANAKKQIGKEDAITNYQAAMGFVETMQNVKDKKLNKGFGNNRAFAAMRNYLTNPLRAVHEMAGFDEDSEFVKSFDAIKNGYFKGQEWAMLAQKVMEPFMTGENRKRFEDASQNAHDFGLKDLNGKDLKISKMQAMQILLTYERETNNENRAHLANAILIPDVDYIKKGQYAKALDNAQKLAALDAQTVKKLRDGLNTAFDRDFMEAARKVFQMAADAVNETSLLLKGRAIATEKFYIPYEVFGDVLNNDFENVAYDISIANMGMTKSVQPNSTASLVIRGLDTVMNKHISDTAKYYGLAIPVRNFTKAYNTKLTAADAAEYNVFSAKNAIRDAWGADAMKLIEQAVADVQGSRPGDRSKILDAIRSAWVTATLAGNVSVWMKQAASYPTAGSVLSGKALIAGLKYLGTDTRKRSRQALWAEIDEHTPLHYMRRAGLSTQELGDFSQSKGFLKRLSDRAGRFSPMNWIQSMDVRTTAALWVACKAQAKSDNYQPGTDAYWEHVTELYQQVLEETQPMYDPMHRAEITKNKAQHFIVFQTQPLQNSGILRTATMEWRAAVKTYGKGSEQAKAAGKRFLKATTSQLASHMVFAAMTAIAAGILHKMNPWRDDDKELTVESVLGEFMKEVGTAYFGAVLPVFGNYIVSALERVLGGSRYDVLSEPVVDRINTTVANLQRLQDPSVENVLAAITDILSYTGFPAGNIYNIANGIRLHAEDIINGHAFTFEAGVSRTTAQERNRLYEALVSGDQAKVGEIKAIFKTEEEYLRAVRQTLTEHDDRIQAAVEARQDMDMQTYTSVLNEIIDEGVFSRDDVLQAAESANSAYNSAVKAAYTAQQAGDEKAFLQKVADIVAKGYDEAAFRQAVKDYVPKATDGEDEDKEVQWLSASDTKAFLYKALLENDASTVAILKQAFDTEKKYHNAIVSALKENDPRIREASEARLRGDSSEYLRITKQILAEKHFTQDDVVKAVNGVMSSIKSGAEEDENATVTPWWEDESESGTSFGFKKADLQNAFASGDRQDIELVISEITADAVAKGKTQEDAQSSAESTVASALKDLYLNDGIDAAGVKTYLKRYSGDDDNDVYWILDNWDYAKENGKDASYGKYYKFYEAVQTGKNLKSEVQRYLAHGVKKETLASQITSYFKPIYKDMNNTQRAALKGYLLNAYAALGYNRYKKSKDIDKWLKS